MPVRRLQGMSGPGLAFVTPTVADWKPLLRSSAAADLAAAKLEEVLLRSAATLVEYVIMPNHVHFLAAIPELAELSRLAQAYKSLTSRAVQSVGLRSRKRGSAFWKRRFDDLIIRSDKQFKVTLGYIHTNPVRAGQVERATDWRWSNSRAWELGENGPLDVDTSFEWVEEYETLQT